MKRKRRNKYRKHRTKTKIVRRERDKGIGKGENKKEMRGKKSEDNYRKDENEIMYFSFPEIDPLCCVFLNS
jgi:hypothetical protein